MTTGTPVHLECPACGARYSEVRGAGCLVCTCIVCECSIEPGTYECDDCNAARLRSSAQCTLGQLQHWLTHDPMFVLCCVMRHVLVVAGVLVGAELGGVAGSAVLACVALELATWVVLQVLQRRADG